MSNPLLTDKKFATSAPPAAWPAADHPGWAAPTGPGGPIPPSGDPASPWPPPQAPAARRTLTRGGVARITGLLFLLVCTTAAVGWGAVETETTPELVDGVITDVTRVTAVPAWVFLVPLLGLGLFLVTLFKPRLAKFTAPAYALAQGVFIGAISKVFETQWPGIVGQAVLLTLGVFAVMLALYASGRIRVTPRFQLVVIAATLGIMAVYLVSFVASLFGGSVPYIHGSGPIGIAFSVFVVGVAAMNLALDFDFIDRQEAARVDKDMEWFAAFGLMVTLIWLYLEILRLLAKLRER